MPTIPVDTSTDGTALVAAPASNQIIRIKGFDLTANGTVTVSLKSNNSTVIWSTYAMADTTKGGIAVNVNEIRDLDCLPGESLNIGLSASIAVKGSITYVIKGPPS